MNGSRAFMSEKLLSTNCVGRKTRLAIAIFAVLMVAHVPLSAQSHNPFVRGDSNGDSRVSFADIMTTLHYLYRPSFSSSEPPCLDAADFDDSGVVDISDAFSLLSFIYFNSRFPPAPYPGADFDLTDDPLDCASGSVRPRASPLFLKQHARDPSPGQEVDFIHFNRLDVEAAAGQLVSVGISIENKKELSGLTLSFRADPTQIQLHRVVFDEGTLLELREYRPEFTQPYTNRLQDGYLATTMFLDYAPPLSGRAIPRNEEKVHIANLLFTVSPDAVAGEQISVGISSVPPTDSGRPAILNEFSVLESTEQGDFMQSVIPLFDTRGLTVTVAEVPGSVFVRGDGNQDGNLDLSDVIALLGYLFLGTENSCPDALDVNDDGIADLTDGIGLAKFLFKTFEPPHSPYPEPGLDPTDDDLGRCD